jgi:hypothetical protein
MGGNEIIWTTLGLPGFAGMALGYLLLAKKFKGSGVNFFGRKAWHPLFALAIGFFGIGTAIATVIRPMLGISGSA